MHLRPVLARAAAAAALALTLGGAGIAASAAGASASTGSKAAAHQAIALLHGGAAARISNFYTYPEPNFGGTQYSAQCIQGMTYTWANQLFSNDPVKSAQNNCEYRVYLQYGGGISFCIDPHSWRTNISVDYWRPGNVFIGNSTDSC